MRFSIEEYQKYILDRKIDMLTMLENGHSGHIGGSFSCIDALTVLYFECIKNTNNRFVYSKGHCEIALYSLLIEENQIPPEFFSSLKCFGSMLQGHPSKKWIESLDYSGGSLGQGLSFAAGMALCGLEDNFHVYCMLGDGELQEGQVYEALLTSTQLHLNNLTVLIDCNGLQLEGAVPVSCSAQQQAKLWSAVGWQTEIINGHNICEIQKALVKFFDVPKAIFLQTVKGHGVPFMENNPQFHGVNLSAQVIQKAKLLLRSAE